MCNETKLSEYDIADLRQDCGLTVRSPMSSKNAFSNYQRSKTVCCSHVRSNSRSLSTACPANLSKKQGQLAHDFGLASPAIASISRSERLCCCNYCCRGSTLSLPIRQLLSTLFFYPRNSLKVFKRTPALIFTLFFILFFKFSPTSAEFTNGVPLLQTDASAASTYSVFDGKGRGVAKSTSLDFQTLKIFPEWDGLQDVLLLSGRDFIYMVNASATAAGETIHYSKRLTWKSRADLQNQCWYMGKSKFECNNFLRVVELHDNKLFVCGTNSYEPKCRYYSKQSFSDLDSSRDSTPLPDGQCDRQCPCPFNPTTSSVSLFANTSSGNYLFSAFIDNFMANHPVLLKKGDPLVYSMTKWFNDPTFVKFVEAKNGKIYLFFRETAKSVETGKEPTLYGRVAQVCKNDRGGTTVLEQHWTSFLKARLLCSIPGSATESSFTFNNLTSVSDITTITGPDGKELDVVFVTFTTPWNWKAVAMSAVCVYSMDDIESLFDHGRFFSEQVMHLGVPTNGESSLGTVTKGVPVPESEILTPRPGKCLKANTPITGKLLHFAKEHFLMFDPVRSLYNRPIFISKQNVRATQIVLDTHNTTNLLVAYIGTENGKVLRIRPDFQQPQGFKTLLLEETSVAEQEDCQTGRIPCGIRDMKLFKSLSPRVEPKLFVAFTDRLVRVPLSQCQEYANAECCNTDPDCGWAGGKCRLRSSSPKHRFDETSSISNAPKNCQVQKSTTCTMEELYKQLCASYFPTSNNDQSSHRGSKSKKQKNGPRRNGYQRNEVVLVRSVDRGRIGNANDQSNNAMVTNRRGCEHIRTDRVSGNSEEEITNLFIKHILPSISSDFGETVQTLQGKDRHAALLQQLRTAMVETTRLVLNNYKKDHCLPTRSVNTLVHTYPILLREIESWHYLALKKMKADVRWSCWDNTESDCTSKISFSVSFAPTLWGPLTNLIQEFGGTCDARDSTVPNQDSSSERCHDLPGVLPCKDQSNSNSSICRTQKCQFSEYAVDVKAFFRHVNDSRNFLSANSGGVPFRKSVVRNLTGSRTIQNYLELTVGPTAPFQILYIPSAEKVKITFYYSQIRDCVASRRGCSTVGSGCNAKIERKLTKWFNSIMKKLMDDARRCDRQIKKANIAGSLTGANMSRRKRYATDNTPVVPPRNCLYMKKTFKFSSRLWEPLVRRAQDNRARYYESQQSLVFYMKSDVKQFFEQHCSEDPMWSEKRKNLVKTVRRRRFRSLRSRFVDVEIFVSNTTPFVIERTRQGRLRIKFFTAVSR